MSEEKEAKKGIETDGPEEAQLPRGANHLFVIGIDKYREMPRLYNAVKDAEDIVEVLTGKYQFDKEHFRFLPNEEATQDNIIGYFEELAKKVKERDTLLVYFSGHGEYHPTIDTGYWIPYDAREGRIGSYIGFDLIKKYVGAIPSFHTFIIADSCYSGHLFTEKSGAGLDAIESIPSRWLLTAGRNEVVSDGKPGDNSPFADAILWLLRNNAEPRIAAADFCQRIQLDVKSNASQLPRGEAMHGVGHRGGQFMFRLKQFRDTVFEKPATAVRQPAPEGAARGTISSEPAETKEPDRKKMEPLRTLQDLRARLKDYIRESEFKLAFDLFNQVIDDNSGRENDIIMQQSQFSSISKQIRDGLVDPNFAQVTLNRIRFALNSIADELGEDDLRPGALQPERAEAANNNSGNSSAYLDELERQGLLQQAEILTKKLNFFRQEKARAFDAAQKFNLEEQIREIEGQLKEIREKLQ